MSPVLLDHRHLKLISLSIGILVATTFFVGYTLGFEKSNDKWKANLVPMEIDLPDAGASALAIAHPQIPEFEEPGASVDVDVADEVDSNNEIVNNNTGSRISSIESTNKINVSDQQAVGLVSLSDISKTRQSLLDIVSGIDDPSKSEALTMVDTASEETARYSIQVGMYSSFANADAKVQQLKNANLNAYLDSYTNNKDEERYNVRFGYFSTFKTGLKALYLYEKKFSGSGYVARIIR